MSVQTRVPAPSRLRFGDAVRVGGVGLRTRPLRAVLSALGIAIGIAAMIGVVGISASSQANLAATLDRLGTNLLTVRAGSTLLGGSAKLPVESVATIARIGPVTAVSATGLVNAKLYRTDRIPAAESGGTAVLAARTDLPTTVGARVARGQWLNDATARYPTVVLGAATARRLGLAGASGERLVWLGERWFTVVGILAPVELAPELDESALVGWTAAQHYLGFDGHPTTVYERSRDDAVDAVRQVLPATVNPEHPDEVAVSRPSDVLAAREAADEAFTGLLLGLGAVALLVGGVGVANTMVISVLERRAEIGLRRSLGAGRRHIRRQFIAEALLLSALGGVAGVLVGIVVTGGYAMSRGWPTVAPVWATAGGVVATLLIGGLAGLVPAIRAARLAPTEALAI
ncbi:ABC transporter permease [Actinopolymorpha pittospori]